MSHMSSQSSAASNEFDAAKMIVEALQGLDKQLQARALRFASESLGLQPFSPTLSIGTAAQQSISLATGPSNIPLSKSMDIRQFVEAKVPKSDQQFAAVVAYYYHFEAPDVERKEFINAKLLQEATRLAGRSRLRNPIKTLHNAKNSGYLDSSGGGNFKISTVGENLVAIALPGKGAEVSAKRTSGTRKTTNRVLLKKKTHSRRR